MPARLTVLLVANPSKTYLAGDEERLVVGRGADCNVRLDDERVSRRHARLAPSAGVWWLEDLGSKNGTMVDGAPAARVALASDCWLSFGGVPARFEQLSTAALQAVSLERAARRQRSLAAQTALTPDLGQEALLGKLLDSAIGLTGAERGFVMLRGGAGDFEILASRELSESALAASEFTGSVGALERVVRERRPVVTANAQAEAGLAERPSIVGRVGALASLPLVALDRLIGVLYVDSSKPGAFLEELDVEILEGLASHAALVISSGSVERELQSLAGRLPTAAEAPGGRRLTSLAGLLRHHAGASS